MKRNRNKRSVPEISTASLPDIIFMLLFFFMVVTVMRQDSPLISVRLPDTTFANDLSKADRQLVIRVGATSDELQIGQYKIDSHRLQEVLDGMTAHLSSSEREQLAVMLYADGDAMMSDVGRIKQELRKRDLRNVRYVTTLVQD